MSLENLIGGFPAWWRVFKSIVTHPFRFAADLDANAPRALHKAFRYFLYSMLIAFILLAPALLAHQVTSNKLLLVGRFAIQFMLYAAPLHFAFRLLGSKQPFNGTLVSYTYLASTGLQLYLLLALPWTIALGPNAVLGGWSDRNSFVTPNNTDSVVAIRATGSLLGYLALYPMLRWFQITHEIAKWKLVVALAFSVLVAAPVQLFLLAPAFRWLEGTLGRFLDLF